MKNHVDYNFMADVGDSGWSKIKFDSGYAQALVTTANQNRFYIDESPESLKQMSHGNLSTDLGPQPPKVHVWRYGSRPNKGNIEPLAQVVGSHLHPVFDDSLTQATATIKLDSSYESGGTVEHRIRERLIPPLFYQCGHKCHRERLSRGYAGIEGQSLIEGLKRVSKTRCCRCIAVARWFGVQSIDFPRDRHTGEQLHDLAAARVRLVGDIIDHQAHEYPAGRKWHMTFRNGVMGPDTDYYRSYGSPSNYAEWHPVEADKESMCRSESLKWNPKHFGWWSGLFRPYFLQPKIYSYSGRQVTMRLADSRGVISGRKGISDFLCLPCLAACKAVPSWAFWLARGYSQENAMKFHRAEVKVLCPDKIIKNPDNYKWKRTDQIPNEIFRWHKGDSGQLIGDKLYAKQDWV